MSGYFFELINGKNSLYKKIKTDFKDAVPTPNSYTSEKPATIKTNLRWLFYKKNKKMKRIFFGQTIARIMK
ncbi:hypothetical protein [Chryseobacterium sp. GP-SGM7]|uniref:hypothetical protein n=1 Tax=Chryseobacterium sp. GP-SGM7 TaxID=3411323 RepID=UPI003B93CE87